VHQAGKLIYNQFMMHGQKNIKFMSIVSVFWQGKYNFFCRPFMI